MANLLALLLSHKCIIMHLASAGVVMLLRELHKQAQAEGGAVYMLNGNHESLNVSGNFRYMTTFPSSDCANDMGAQLWSSKLS